MRLKQQTKPWEALGISRATWYRRGKSTTKPSRVTQAQRARIEQVSLRSLQRRARIHKHTPELMPLIESGELSMGFVDQLIRNDKVVQFVAERRAGGPDPEFDNWLASLQDKHNRRKTP